MGEALARSLNTPSLAAIHQLDGELAQYFHAVFKREPHLSRAFVSFQANKELSSYRWYKYKEAFSAPLVEYLFTPYGIRQGRLLDPFAGSGTALFAAQSLGLDTHGIELLPIGQQIILARMCLERDVTNDNLERVTYWATSQPWQHTQDTLPLPTLRITDGAYAPETVVAIEHYLAAVQQEHQHVQMILQFALLCILESISYTRKDGQYLRWDYRSHRRQGAKPFNKGHIPDFSSAIGMKLQEIIDDTQQYMQQMSFFETANRGNVLQLDSGSCLDILPTLPSASYDAIMTSPPYCNRYDYTRTYALELALLGISQQELVHLRQQMISCTVEHRAKDLLRINPNWHNALTVADNQPLLQAILQYLEHQKATKQLNNNGIPRMVRGYFYEMACVIAECARVLKPGGLLFMVNDNVRYAGASISVDMILSHMAEQLGFAVESILVLPNGKGNSSQQMGQHGRDVLRKCVYVWRRRG
jgi:DNA modification methylase